jgi:hypothetical protein
MIDAGFAIEDSPPWYSVLGCFSQVLGRLEQRKLLRPLNAQLHSAHCRACKERVGEFLTAVYGECRVNASFPWSSLPEDYDHTPIGELLQRIRTALSAWRGHGDFIRTATMPPCDFYVTDPPFILEFDESQHFSRARLIALELYPETAKVGFSVHRWREMCRQIAAIDDEPFDRDERRAWYDTLRDWLPGLHGFEPTARIYAGEHRFCALCAESSVDQTLFRRLMEGRLPAPR